MSTFELYGLSILGLLLIAMLWIIINIVFEERKFIGFGLYYKCEYCYKISWLSRYHHHKSFGCTTYNTCYPKCYKEEE